MRYIVYAYGGLHEALTFDEAYETARWFMSEDIGGLRMFISPTSANSYELVGFGTDREGDPIIEDSNYITAEVGDRLLAMGLVYIP